MNMARGERKNHKYLYKKNVNGKTRYFYDVGKANWKNGNHNIGEDGMETDSNIRGYTKIQDILGYDERDRRNRAVARYKNANETFENQKEMSYDDLEKSSKGFYFGIDDYYHSVFSKDELLSIAECLTKVANSCEEEDV